MREIISKMVTNKSLFHPGNFLIHPKNPCADLPDDGCYGDVEKDGINKLRIFDESSTNGCIKRTIEFPSLN